MNLLSLHFTIKELDWWPWSIESEHFVTNVLQPSKKQVSKEIVHELQLGDIAVKQNINNLQ